MHTHTLLYKILVEDVFGEAKTPTVASDFEWPKVLMAINLVKRTGKTQEFFVTGKSHKYKNYGTGGDVEIKVTVIKKPADVEAAAEYSLLNKNVFNKPVIDGLVKANKFINPGAVFRDFYNRVLNARGDLPKLQALRKGLIDKMKRYGAPDDWLSSFMDMIDTIEHNLDSSDSYGIVPQLFKKAVVSLDEMLKREGVLARGEIKIYVEPGVPDLQYKAAYIHELTHAFDPKVHLPHRVRGEVDFYIVDPVELDASLNEFAVVVKEFPDEFNAEVKDMIAKRGADEDDFKILVTKYGQFLGQHGIDGDKLFLYLEKVLTLLARIKKSNDHGTRSGETGSGGKVKNKFMQKLMNILGKPNEQLGKSLRDRLSDYKGSKKRDESQGFWDSPPPIPAPATPMNKATPGVVDDSLLQEVLRETFGATNGAYKMGMMFYGDKRITPQNKSFKQYPEVLAMCKDIIQRGVSGLSAAEASRVVYLVALMIVSKSSSLALFLSRLMNAKNMVRIDGLLPRFLKVAIEMEF